MKTRVFISFDYDHDHDLKIMLIGQSRNSDSPFEVTDMSIKHSINKYWKDYARQRIKGCDVVIIICGEHTSSAQGVSEELKIASEEGIPYFLLQGHSKKPCERPKAADRNEKIYAWTWDNLKKLIGSIR